MALSALPAAACTDTGEGDDTAAALANATRVEASDNRRVETAGAALSGQGPNGLRSAHDGWARVPEAAANGSAQGAANVVKAYYALIERGLYREASDLWADGASGLSAGAFAASFGRYREYHATIGAPGQVEGAAGSLYVEIPVRIQGRSKNGEAFAMQGAVTMRRVNDVPGSTAKQRRWHIAASEVRPGG